MQIRVSTGDCRAAIVAAQEALVATIAADRAKFAEVSLKHLREGAEHNGLHVDANRLQEMKEMVDRDVEHAMKTHPGVETQAVLANFLDMLDFHSGSEITIDDQDFHLIKKHLKKPDAPAETKSAGVASLDERFVMPNSGDSRFVKAASA